ncbi:MAG: hypothetical protein H6627_01875 [Calditrichae bacterium]|nr:hypothetical protein [Calditrichota bacterium]MCB9057281.1 hypothetical protein [Calditrichia bacterium]
MNPIDEIKEILKEVVDKAPQSTKDAWEKARKFGDDGLESSKEFLGEVSDKVSEIGSLAKMRFEIYEDNKRLDDAFLALGKVTYEMIKQEKTADETQEKIIEKQMQRIADLNTRILEKTQKYEQSRKEQAGKNYVIDKFSDELAKSGHIMDQARVSENSNLNGKLMKDVLLPKLALITSIKRGDDLLIPDGNTQFKSGDLVTVIGAEDDVQKIIKRLVAE